MNTTQLQASNVINPPSDKIFTLLEDPDRHAALDGPGTLRGPANGTPPISAVGQVFATPLPPSGSTRRACTSTTA